MNFNLFKLGATIVKAVLPKIPVGPPPRPTRRVPFSQVPIHGEFRDLGGRDYRKTHRDKAAARLGTNADVPMPFNDPQEIVNLYE